MIVDCFSIVFLLIAGSIVLFIIKAVTQTKSDIDKRFKFVDPAKRNELMKDLTEQIRGRDIKCTRCGKQTFVPIGTENKYKCHSCNFEFEGPEHLIG